MSSEQGSRRDRFSGPLPPPLPSEAQGVTPGVPLPHYPPPVTAFPLTAQQLADLTGATLEAEGDAPPVTGLETLEHARPGDLTFIGEGRYASGWADSDAQAALVSHGIDHDALHPIGHRYLLRVPNADLAMAAVLEAVAPNDPPPNEGTDPTATIGAGSRIAPTATVGAHAVLGTGCVLHPGAHVYPHARLGDGCVLWPGAVVREHCTLGHRCTLHSHAVLGTDGFGYRPDATTTPPRIVKVPHLGHVTLGDDVELGAGCTIDRGKFSDTTVGHGCKFDNQVVIGHNCRIGNGVMISGNTGVAGSTTIGDYALIGGMASIGDHLHVGAGAKLAGCAQLMHDVPPGEAWAGIPAQPAKQFMRQVAATQKLPDLLKRLRKFM